MRLAACCWTTTRSVRSQRASKTTPAALAGGAATALAPTAASTRSAITTMAAGAWRALAGRRGSVIGEAGRGAGARSRVRGAPTI